MFFSVKNHLGDVKQLNICTELVTGAETDCTNSARRWQIPVLDPSWIVESLVQVTNQIFVIISCERFQIFAFLLLKHSDITLSQNCNFLVLE